MIYVLIYWIVGVVVNLLLTFIIGRGDRSWMSFLLYWIVSPFIFPITLIALRPEISSAFKKMRQSPEQKRLDRLKEEREQNFLNKNPIRENQPFSIKHNGRDVVISEKGNGLKLESRIIPIEDIPNYQRNSRYVLYVDDERYPAANSYIKEHYESIQYTFRKLGYLFIYLPHEMERMIEHYGKKNIQGQCNAQDILTGIVQEDLGDIGGSMVRVLEKQGRYALHSTFIPGDDEDAVSDSLVAYWCSLLPLPREEAVRCRCEEKKCIQQDSKEDIIREVEELAKELNVKVRITTDKEELPDDGDVRFRMVYDKKAITDQAEIEEFFADDDEEECLHYHLEDEEEIEGTTESLTERDRQLLEEIETRVSLLSASGLEALLLKGILKPIKKSHLEVTPDARILLTDYHKEVQMLPIDKVVYIFYLRHPEGISIKSLTDHKEELMVLYARVTGKTELTDKQKATVERLCDPWDNSINEKLSRIRKSFCAEVHESVADSYVVKGSRGENRYISLDEELIELGDWGRPSFSSSVSREGS